MATDNHTAPDTEGTIEEPTETRTVQQLIDAGCAGHVRGSGGGAMIDVELPLPGVREETPA